MKKVVGLLFLLVFAACLTITMASPAVGVTPTLIGRGTYDPFKVKSDHASPVDFEAKAKSAVDIVVRTHDYAPGGSTGWHTHPGPVFITVLQGTVTFYEVDDPTCTPTIVSAGQGYVDTGRGHYARNETGVPAKDVTVIMAPVGLPFRGELAAPGPYCAF
ncbi:MAG: cupin domain-containing protein [Acidobacteria bacterium]|nr:cupin domain-containing protein [Acidobacteriota bacterium]